MNVRCGLLPDVKQLGYWGNPGFVYVLQAVQSARGRN